MTTSATATDQTVIDGADPDEATAVLRAVYAEVRSRLAARRQDCAPIRLRVENVDRLFTDPAGEAARLFGDLVKYGAAAGISGTASGPDAHPELIPGAPRPVREQLSAGVPLWYEPAGHRGAWWVSYFTD